MNSRLIFIAGWVALACSAAASAPGAGTVVSPDFAMLDQNGRHWQLSRVDAKAVVLFFTANGCPIARQSIVPLKELEERFGPEGVAFWWVNSNSGDDRESIGREAEEFGIRNAPILKDETQGVAAFFGVKRTGTAVCIETATRKVFYQGAMDDRLTEGAQKPAATKSYLAEALEQFLAGESVAVANTVARGCLIAIDGPTEISYAKDVAPMLQRNCVGCHSPGNIGPFAMNSYGKVRGMREMIQEVLLARRMPPWQADPLHGKFHNDISLSAEERRTLLRWIEQGAPRGEGDDPLEGAVGSVEEWPLGKPDAVVSLPEVQEIPATGVLDYRYIRVATGFEKDQWLRGVVARPGNNRVVHHIIVRVKEPGKKEDRTRDAFLLGWAPGGEDMFFPEGTGKLIPKGTELEFEMHYTTSGKAETDQSSIGLYFLEEKPRMVIETHAPHDGEFELRPHDGDQTTFATYTFRRDSYLYDLSPHMHLRGAWFKFEALYPNGEREVLLSVPNYDFNWQHNYRLAEPKRMPRGTWILCSGGFDNSKLNPHNPDPSKTIRWGEQSWDEMFIGFIGVAEIPREQAASN